ncbi:hypothetical protein [Verrucomicrobium sp. BvORR106]|uniref:hypothetical protein n=1 Tax=Verrucomicrobium sp. BvORR106 TaxID=1403819 RepID=UPI002240FE4C|nr:hypothetical protein [Verrucomicrobium sp. BvORR106]
MPTTYKSAEAAAQDSRAVSRESHPNARLLQQTVRFAKFNITLSAVLLANDILKLGSLQMDGAVVIPELSRLTRVTAGGGTAINTAFKLQSVLGTAAAVDESASATLNTGTSATIVLARTTAAVNTVLTPDSALQLLIGTVTAAGNAGDVVAVEVAYRAVS